MILTFLPRQKKMKRQKIEFNIATSGQFRTLVMFSSTFGHQMEHWSIGTLDTIGASSFLLKCYHLVSNQNNKNGNVMQFFLPI